LAWSAGGARGSTAREIERVLEYPVKGVHAAHESLLRTWADPQLTYSLYLANRVFVDQGQPLQPEFVQLTREHYGARAQTLDIQSATEASRRHINQWVNQRTQAWVPEVIPPNGLQADAVVVIVNALYLKGAWTEAFNPQDTQTAPFYLENGRVGEVPMMQRQAVGKYFENANIQILELPYRGQHLVMRIILPRERAGLMTIEQTLSATQLNAWFASLDEATVDVRLPNLNSS